MGVYLSAQPVVTARFANPQYDCTAGEYCLDVEFQSDTPGEEIFGINLRFFFDEGQLTLINTRDFQGGYTGSNGTNPYVPAANTLAPNAGPVLFNFTHPTATFVNGAISKTNSGATPIFISTTGWTKLFQVCFSVDDPGADLDNFCPNIVWDLEFNPANGGFPAGDDGLVITVVNPDPNFDSSPTIENVVQYNWDYFDPNSNSVPPFGFLTEDVCISTRCIDVSIDIEIDNATPAAGDPVIFTVDLSNAAGFDDAENVIVDVPLPAGFTWVSDDSGGSYNPGTGLWTVPLLASGSTTTLTINATVNASGPYQALAEVISHDGTDIDSTPGNGVDTNGNMNVENDDDPLPVGDEDDGDGVEVMPLNGSISVTKVDDNIDLGLDGVLNEGDVINYTITVTNTGDAIISNLVVTDSGADGPINCLATTLLVGQSTTCSATHTITQADLDAGIFINQATADGEDPLGNPVTDTSDDPDDQTDNDANGDGEPDDPTATPLQQNPGISLEKTGTWNDDGDGAAEVGETITYIFKVTNTGNVTLTNITIADLNAAVVGGPIPVLLPGQMDQVTFTGSHTLTQADIDNGSFTNQAVATALPPLGPPITDDSDDPTDPTNIDTDGDTEPDDPTVTGLPQAPELTVEKVDALNDGGDGLQAGDFIDYTITVTNTGNVTATGVTVTDPELSGLVCVPSAPSTLAPGESMVCTGSYQLQQADINSGSYSNTATADGFDPNGTPVTDDSDDPDTPAPNDPTVTDLPQNPELTVEKVDALNDGGDGLQAGDFIDYTITVTNTGNVSVSGVTVTDPDISGMVCFPATPITLAPGESVTCVGFHQLTLADFNAGFHSNTATADGFDPNGTPVTDDSDDPDTPAPNDPTVTDLPQNPELVVEKVDALNDGGDGLQAGDLIDYSITVTNSGNVSISGVTVTDPELSGLICVPSAPATLNPGQTMVCTGFYVLTQADIDAGSYSNTATADGFDPNGTPVTDGSDDPDTPAPNDPTVTPLPPAPELTVEKVDALDDGGDGLNPGDFINYTITVTNTGNVSVSGVTVTDPELTGLVCVPAAPATLAPGGSMVCTGSYQIQQADINLGLYINTATADGFDPNGTPVTDGSDDPDTPAPNDPTVTVLVVNPELTVEKVDALNDGGDGLQAGDFIDYSITVTNTGNVTINNVTVNDPEIIGLVCVPAAPATLAPGETMVCTGFYILTQADINAGSYSNTATANGLDPSGAPVSDASDDPDTPAPNDPTVTPLPQSPELEVLKVDNLDLNTGGCVVADNGSGTIDLPPPCPYLGQMEITVGLPPGDQILIDVEMVSLSLVSVVPGGTLGGERITFNGMLELAMTGQGGLSGFSRLINVPASGIIDVAPRTPGDPVQDFDSDLISLSGVIFGDPDFDLLRVRAGSDFGLPSPGHTTLTRLGPPGGDFNVDSFFDIEYRITFQGAPGSALDGMNGATQAQSPFQAGGPAVTQVSPGDMILYDITVTNTGNVTVTGVTVSDPNADPGSVSCPQTDLEPGESMTCTAKRTLTQADIDAGSYSNTATANGLDPNGTPVTDGSDDPDTPAPNDPTVTPLPQNPQLTVEKTDVLEDGGDGLQPGDFIDYTITITNTGNVTVSGVTLNDPELQGVLCAPSPPAALAPGESMVCVGFIILTQADIDNGSYSNTATADGLDPNGAPVTDGSDDPGTPAPNDPTVTPLPQTPELTVEKVDVLNDGGDGLQAGDFIDYTITVMNTGNVSISGVTVTDPELTGLVCVPAAPATLAPGESMVCTGFYQLTQADINAGSYSNTATADGLDPNGTPVSDGSDDPDTPAPNDPTVTDLPQNPELTVEKVDALNDGGDGLQAGDFIDYAITVTNTGNVTVSGVTVNDPELQGVICVPSAPATLAPGQSMLCTGFIILTQADIDNGTYSNTATADGFDPNGTPVTDGSDDPDTPAPNDPTVTALPQTPELTVEKVDALDDGGDGLQAGDLIDYTITVTNTGNVSISGVTVNDPNLSGLVCVPAAPATLAPGESMACTGFYLLTQADINAGSYSNTATATGQDPNGTPVTDGSDDPDTPAPNDPTVTPLPQNPELTVEKVDALDDGGDGLQAGDLIDYSIVVTNTGNVTISGVTVNDPELLGVICVPSAPATLEPGESMLCTGFIVLTQADIDNGSYSNTATATGQDPNGTPITDGSDDPDTPAPNDPTVTPLPQTPELTVEKVDALDDGGDGLQAGDFIDYTITVTNTGNVTVSGVTVNDPELSGVVCVPAAPSTLAPGESMVCTGFYQIQQADIDNGSYSNTATATSQDPNGTPVTDDSDDPGTPAPNDPTVTPLQQVPELTVEKEDFLDDGGDGLQPGDIIDYVITVTNTGNVSISGVGVNDPELQGLACFPIPPATLAPGESMTCSGFIVLTQADIDAGFYSNTATANGQDPNGNPASDDSDDPNTTAPNDPTVTPLPQTPQLTVEKVDALDDGGDGLQAGDVIDYTITVTNTGNVTVSGIVVIDGDLPNLSCTPSEPATLAPGESMACTGTYVLTQADINAGSFSNTAFAVGLDPNNNQVSDDSDDPDTPAPNDPTVTPLPQNPELTVEKVDALDDGGDGVQPGDIIDYSITVTNTGNVTMSGVTVNDPEVQGLICVPAGPATLEPGESMVCTGFIVLTQADIDAGSYTNTATATGQDPNGTPITDGSDDPDTPAPNDPTVTDLPQTPELTTTKVDALDLGANGTPDVGDVIDYVITVTNTGNVTISGVTINDPMLSGLNCSPAAPATLAPGDVMTCSGFYLLTQADIDSRIISNQAFVDGTDPNGAPVTDESDDPDTQDPNDPTLTELPCVTIEAWVYLEGAAIFNDGSANYALPMRTDLNDLRLLPGQTLNDLFLGVQYTPAGQPYNIAPWNYNGNEGDNFDSMGDLMFADAGYPSTVVDWVLVSLRDNPNGTGGPICQAAALLHADGHIQFVDQFECCDIDLIQDYYLVIEHRNHLIVMSHQPIDIVGGVISYDFRVQQSYILDPFGFGHVGQKEILPGVFAMHGGNGNQTLSAESDTDINFDDRTYWEAENVDIAKYRIGDYNLNGDTNFNDRRVWELNNGKFTSVPRD